VRGAHVCLKVSNHGTPLHPFFFSQLDLDEIGLSARVAFASRGHLRFLDGTLARTDEPAVVGDWVVVRDGRVTRRLERASTLRRRDPAGGAQVVAANVDLAVVCLVAGQPRNARRLERWLTVCAGIPHLVVLTKADLGDDDAVAGLRVSALAGDGLAELRAAIGDGTAVLLGASGAGKSTLTNALLGGAVMATGEVDDLGRGRHTTTTRELFALPGGGWLVDGPGVRQIAPVDADAIAEVFADVEALALRCRYRDCGHGGEPGCAVREAVDPERLAAWEKLRREAAYEARRGDAMAERAERERWKRIHKEARRRGDKRG
jgi:ribosome biogenesis GTPase / thiamine phosphate phosphatase